MTKEMTIIGQGLTVKGKFGEPVNPVDGVAPLVIQPIIEDGDKSEAISQVLNAAGILTFTFKSESIESAVKALEVVFTELRQDDRVASEYIVFTGYGEAGRASLLAANNLGASVGGIFLMAPAVKVEDLRSTYPGQAMILASSQDEVVPVHNLEEVAKKLKHGQVLEIRDGHHEYRVQDLDRASLLLRTFIMTLK
ncbi:alpha/beta hydrolase [Lactobacillus equicursoris]|uniref:alpha/beta hydrolase n=1 Tax=Lactobacillus equicursoris TaxID=420645 RepID=UPI003991EBDA